MLAWKSYCSTSPSTGYLFRVVFLIIRTSCKKSNSTLLPVAGKCSIAGRSQVCGPRRIRGTHAESGNAQLRPRHVYTYIFSQTCLEIQKLNTRI
jgi:hypothetical protein